MFCLKFGALVSLMPTRVLACVFFLIIDIQHAQLHSNTTCFRVKYSQYGYHLCRMSSIFYRYGMFTFGILMYLLLFNSLSTALLAN